MEKTQTTSKEFAQGLLYSLKKFSNHFYEDFSVRAQEMLGIKLNKVQLATLKREVYMLNLWIISKILSPDRKVLDELHKIYLLPHINEEEVKQWLENKETDKLKNVLKQDETDLHERYTKYYADCDDKLGGNQAILTTTIAENLLNNGQPDMRFIRIDLQFLISTHVFGMMKAIMELRTGYEVVD